MEILDNKNVLAQRDPDGALQIIAETWKQLTWEASVQNVPTELLEIDNIVLAGMGGSALGGLVVKSWIDTAIPFEIVRDYDLPLYVGEKTLVICVSVSGNTEETVHAFDMARSQGAQVAVIATGGRLLERARVEKVPFVQIDKVDQPRYGVPMHLRAITKLMDVFGLATIGSYDELALLAEIVKDKTAEWTPDKLLAENKAKMLAVKCIGKTPVIYASTKFAPVAYKWKISFNENAKNVAFWNAYPEFNHNEFIGWSSHPIEKPFAVFDLHSSFDNPRIKKRFEISSKLLSGLRPAAIDVRLHGDSMLCQMICGFILADFVSIYLAILNNVNPSPVELVEKLKLELG